MEKSATANNIESHRRATTTAAVSTNGQGGQIIHAPPAAVGVAYDEAGGAAEGSVTGKKKW